MIDINKAITTTAKTGRIQIGAKSALKSAKAKKAKLIIFASNCPSGIQEEIEQYCKIAEIPVSVFKGESTDLGALCGKPYTICVLTVKDPGDSQILKITEE
ncbi:MAG: 50S ribosomal protein L30e [Candidatus Bathyarchaeota archaeon]|nr:50S ribosomal protein L30e [Candidatus Bathyarchaeum tardum]